MERKRIRSANFTPEEKRLCLSLIENYKDILEIKKTNAATWREKEEVWKKIEFNFNSHCPAGIKRTKESLKKFYDNTKKTSRRLAAKERYAANVDDSPLNDTESVIPTFELEIPTLHEKPIIGLKNEFDDDTGDSSLPKEEIMLPCDMTENEIRSLENSAVQFDNEVMGVHKELHLNCLSPEGSTEECSTVETIQRKKKYEETSWTSKRRTNISGTNTLARKYEELAAVKIKCSNIQLVILKIEKESAQLKLKREQEECERRSEEDKRDKEQYKRDQSEHEMQKERDEELFNLKRQSLLLDIEIKKSQLQKLNST